jgi:hypothetical protein
MLGNLSRSVFRVKSLAAGLASPWEHAKQSAQEVLPMMTTATVAGRRRAQRTAHSISEYLSVSHAGAFWHEPEHTDKDYLASWICQP